MLSLLLLSASYYSHASPLLHYLKLLWSLKKLLFLYGLFIISRIIFYFCIFMNMYVGNLSYNVKESDLRQVMEEYGVVESVKLITDRETRRSKGFAFVEMPESSEASNAIKELNGAEYAGRPMVVKEALPRN